MDAARHNEAGCVGHDKALHNDKALCACHNKSGEGGAAVGAVVDVGMVGGDGGRFCSGEGVVVGKGEGGAEGGGDNKALRNDEALCACHTKSGEGGAAFGAGVDIRKVGGDGGGNSSGEGVVVGKGEVRAEGGGEDAGMHAAHANEAPVDAARARHNNELLSRKMRGLRRNRQKW
jgi:hypothetical protein